MYLARTGIDTHHLIFQKLSRLFNMCGLAACSYRDSTVSCCELYVLPIVIMTALVLGYELYVLPVVITTSLCGKWFLYLGGDFSSFDKIYLAMPMGLELKHRKCYGLTLNPVFFPLGVPRPRILEVCVMMPVAQRGVRSLGYHPLRSHAQ